MLTYEILETTPDEYILAYYPEGKKDDVGKVAVKVNSKEKKGRIIELAPSDQFKQYAFHAIYHSDVSRRSGTVAWC